MTTVDDKTTAKTARTPVDWPCALAMTAVFLFALGGVASFAQEFATWVPRRAADALMLCGLALSACSLTLVARRMFARGATTRRQRWTRAVTVFLAALPPVLFLAWCVWIHAIFTRRL